AESLGCILWGGRFVKEGAAWYLRIFIDKPGGISIDDCVAMGRPVNDARDEVDPGDREYWLAGCSPSLGRELARPEHFAAFLGAPALARPIRPLPAGRRELRGPLSAYEAGAVTLEAAEGPVTLERGAA